MHIYFPILFLGQEGFARNSDLISDRGVRTGHPWHMTLSFGWGNQEMVREAIQIILFNLGMTEQCVFQKGFTGDTSATLTGGKA